MSRNLVHMTVLLGALALASPLAHAAKKKTRPPPPPAEPAVPDKPPLAEWSAVWHTAATVEYSSCPGTEAGHQEAFTLEIVADDKAIVATETPEQSLARKFTGATHLRDKRWVLELRDKDGKNGMDLWLAEDGKGLAGRRVVVRQSRRALCSVVYAIEAGREPG
jgi:hypothetical protein